MADPTHIAIVTGAATGVATLLAQRAADIVIPSFRDADIRAQQQAIENTRAMVERLAGRIEGLEAHPGHREAAERLVSDSLANPDFSYTMRMALLGAARTNSEIRHEVLSRAVVERILAAPDSTQAVASAQAVEALGRLSGPQLDLLGLAAFLYYVAPVLHAPGDVPQPATINPQDPYAPAREAVIAYLDYISASLPRYGAPAGITLMDFAHLVSASCASFDRTLSRDLQAVLQRHPEDYLRPRGLLSSYRQRMPDSLQRIATWAKLTELWELGLQHVTLAPAGLLIGTVIHEWKTTEKIQIRWDVAPSDIYEDHPVWDGERVNPKVLDAVARHLEAELKNQMRAGGIMPWDLTR